MSHLQLHIVHMKRDYTDLAKALSDPEGVAVLGFFYEVTILIPASWSCNHSVERQLKWDSNEMCTFSEIQ